MNPIMNHFCFYLNAVNLGAAALQVKMKTLCFGLVLSIAGAQVAVALEPVERSHQAITKTGKTHGFVEGVVLQGVVRPVEVAELHFTQAGQVSVIHAVEGSPVRKMDPILSIEHRRALIDYKSSKLESERIAELRIAELAVQQKKKEWEMVEQAFASNAVNPVEREFKKLEYDQAIAALALRNEEQAKAVLAMEAAEAELDRYTLKAPFDGIVVQVRAKVGKSIAVGDPIVTVANLARLEVEMHLPISYFGSIEQGGRAVLLAQAPVNRPLEATATFVSSVIDPTSSTFRAIFTIDNSQGALPSGFCVELQ